MDDGLPIAEEATASKVRLLLRAGANPNITDKNGLTQKYHPNCHTAITLLQQALAEAEKAALLVKARRLAVAAAINTVAPSCLQGRVARSKPLPRVALMPLTDGQVDGENEHGEEDRKLRATLSLLTGLGHEGMPRDVFRVVIYLLMPSWDPLRRKNAGAGQLLGQG